MLVTSAHQQMVVLSNGILLENKSYAAVSGG